jgi:signal transduction histidine kinase
MSTRTRRSGLSAQQANPKGSSAVAEPVAVKPERMQAGADPEGAGPAGTPETVNRLICEGVSCTEECTLAESSATAATAPEVRRERERGRQASVMMPADERCRADRDPMTPEMMTVEQASDVESVAAGVAHDLINLLFSLDCDINTLAALPLPPEGAECVKSLRAITAHIRDLACGLRTLTHDPGRSSAHPETRLADWWPVVSSLLSALVRRGVVLESHLSAGLPPVQIEPHHLTQVVLNLVRNAVDAIRETSGANASGARVQGLVAISARGVRGGHAVRLTVTDNGAGMSREVLARVCEPYFTTKTEQGGTGLGVPMVRRLVAQAGGRLDFSSAPGAGTTVSIELPAACPNCRSR